MLDNFFTQASSQWDGLTHVGDFEHGLWGGVKNEQLRNSPDKSRLGIDHWARRGIAGRAVVLDVAGWRAAQGRPIDCDTSEPITLADLEGTRRAQGLEFEPGDVWIIHRGWVEWYERQPPQKRQQMTNTAMLKTPTLPEGVKLDVYYDRTSLIEVCIDTVVDALLEGGIFVVLVLFLFVAGLRTALIVVLSLPLTFLASFILMGSAGIGSNLMSLGGLAFSVGMVVGASIVVVENIRRHLARGSVEEPKRRVVAEALAEVARPVSFSVLIVAIILVPLFTLQGIEGKMFAPLAATMLIALLVSLVVALTVIPVLSDVFLKQVPEKEFGFIRRFHRAYVRLLDRAVRRPVTVIARPGHPHRHRRHNPVRDRQPQPGDLLLRHDLVHLDGDGKRAQRGAEQVRGLMGHRSTAQRLPRRAAH